MISFGAPMWFWAMGVLPVLVVLYVAAERRSAIKLREFVAPRLLPALVGNIDRFRRAIRFAFILAAIALGIVALARPRWGYTYEDVKRRGLDLLIAVDTSRSMLSNDVAPDRLQRVKLAAQDLVNELNGDRIGLIAFAGRAFLQAPLTIDYDAAVEAINDLDTKTIPEGGTNISEAITLAASTFNKTATGSHALIVFTDGEELSGDATKAAKSAADNGVRIFTVGVGTPQGSLIPLAGQDGTGFVKDPSGQVVKSRLDEDRLRQIAQVTGGMYLHLDGPDTMKQLYQEGLSKMQTAEFDARLSRRPIERYEWPLGIAIVALIVSLFINDRKAGHRRRYLRRVEVAATCLLVMPNVFAVAPGIQAYQEQKYDQALQQFQKTLAEHRQNRAADTLQFDSGAAAYKLRDYDKALLAFSQSLLSPEQGLQSKGHYNLGNTLYQRGELEKNNEKKLTDWNDALKHYEQTLKLEPENKDAKDNYEFVKKKIDDLKNNQQPTPTPPPQQQQQKQKQEKNEDQQQSNSQNSQTNNQQQQQQQQKQQQLQQNQSKNQEPQQQQNQQQPNNANKDQQQQEQQSGNQKDKTGNQSSPSPSTGPGKQPSPSNQQRDDKASAGESPTPNELGPTASASPADGAGGGESPSPTASISPGKRSGEIKSAGEGSDNQQKEGLAEAEPENGGEMTPQQAERLLQAMKDEEARVQLDERRSVHRVYKDW